VFELDRQQADNQTLKNFLEYIRGWGKVNIFKFLALQDIKTPQPLLIQNPPSRQAWWFRYNCRSAAVKPCRREEKWSPPLERAERVKDKRWLGCFFLFV